MAPDIELLSEGGNNKKLKYREHFCNFTQVSLYNLSRRVIVNELHSNTSKRVTEIDNKLKLVYPDSNYSYRELLDKLGRGVVVEVVLPTLELAYAMGIEEKSYA